MEHLNTLAGVKVCTLPLPMIQVQAKRHHRRRIDKKWRKRYGFVSVVDSSVNLMQVMRVGDTWYVYPPGLDAIRKQIESEIA